MAKVTDVTPHADGTYSCTNGIPPRPKRMTAGRFAKIIGTNPWGTDFQAWCEIMRTNVPSFVDTKFTLAGKIIEPKLVEFAKTAVSPYIQDPEQYYETDDAKRAKYYEFFDDNDLFGGMWDALAFDRPNVVDGSGVEPIAVIECKTTSRPQDWTAGVPDNYKAQGLLYAKLLGVPEVYFVVAFLDTPDYDDPKAFECTEDNTRVYCVSADESFYAYRNIEDAMDYAESWWVKHIDDNTSPVVDPKRDAEYLSLLAQCDISALPLDSDEDIEDLLLQLSELDDMIATLEVESGLSDLATMRKTLNSKVQSIIKPALADVENKNSVSIGEYVFTVSDGRKVDYTALERDGLTEKYVTTTKTIRTKRTQKNG